MIKQPIVCVLCGGTPAYSIPHMCRSNPPAPLCAGCFHSAARCGCGKEPTSIACSPDGYAFFCEEHTERGRLLYEYVEKHYRGYEYAFYAYGGWCKNVRADGTVCGRPAKLARPCVDPVPVLYCDLCMIAFIESVSHDPEVVEFINTAKS